MMIEYFPLPLKKNNGEVRLNHFLAQLSKIY